MKILEHLLKSDHGTRNGLPTAPPYVSRRSALLSTLTLIGGASIVQSSELLAEIRTGASMTDLWTAFWPIYDETRSSRSDARSVQLMTRYFAPRIEIYRQAELKHVDAAAVGTWLDSFDEIAADVRRLHLRFGHDYGSYATRFLAYLPDFDSARSPVTLMPSLMNFDAHLVPKGDALPLYFGLDGIVRFHGKDPDLAVLFAHETFHCYQGQRNPGIMLQDKLPVFAGLWIEGGATWVSERINPRAAPVSILLDDRALLDISPKAMTAALLAISAKFDSLADVDAAAFFTTGYKGVWPARVGYLVGLTIARDVAPTMSLGEFSSLPLGKMRLLYRNSLDKLIDKNPTNAP